MEVDNHQMKSFLKEVQNSLRYRERSNGSIEGIENIPLNNMECLYLYDFSKNNIIYHKGFDKVFGIELEALDLDFVFSRYHPDDAPVVKSLVKKMVSLLVDVTIPEFTNVMNLSYRFRNAEGNYVRILSNTIVFHTDDRDRVVSVLIRYTDISFTNESDAVEWNVDGIYLDRDMLASQVYGDERHIFTPREKEIIKKIFDGSTNLEVSKLLNISQHTVATHRKNILLKSGCHNIGQLKGFCKRNGINI